ncbi:hypothetical protein NQZ68_032437 [Dissostichus eleginoides]|nr:hypothetical protein NQZ68_032437 [Dissostichus eleginoides]
MVSAMEKDIRWLLRARASLGRSPGKSQRFLSCSGCHSEATVISGHLFLPTELYGCESGQWAVSVELKAMRVVPGQGEDGLEMPSG